VIVYASPSHRDTSSRIIYRSGHSSPTLHTSADNSTSVTIKIKKKQDKPEKISIHSVKKGETLFSIAKKYGCSVQIIRDRNDLSSDRIYPGMKLKVPGMPLARGKGDFTWPVERVTSYKKDGSNGVKAIGLIIKAPAGSPVFSARSGVVRRVGYMRGYGNYVVIQHGDRYMTVYGHLERISVREGDRVSTRQRIASVDTISRIHFQVDRQGKPVDPLNCLPPQ
jgi:murein DD-endopeptidase MepM/ murein hydrolase activator NlpD